MAVRRLRDCVDPGGAVDFISLYPATSLIPAPPRFTYGTFGAELASGYFRHAHLWEIGVYRLRGFDIFGPFVMCKEGEPFFAPETNLHPAHIDQMVATSGDPRFPRPRQLVTGTAALITGPGYTVYGHWLSDFLPKLYLLQAIGYDIRRLHYLLPSDTPRFGRAWLELLGIPPENVISFDPTGALTWVEELLLPTIFHNGVRVSALLNNAAKFLLAQVNELAGRPAPVRQPRRIFLSRARASQSRPLLNRQRIEEIAGAAGLELVHPESLSLLEQVRLFGEASVLVGEYGSALHGSLFSAPGTTVCNLRGSLDHPGFIQSGIGHALRQPTGYVFGETDGQASDGRFTISEAAFAECLAALFGTAGFEPGC
jgi:capsular polysaccharide biosynthesis protein